MCLTKTKTNWECGMGNELNCRQISTQLGLELEVGIVYMFPECVKEIFLVHIPLSHSTRNCILKNESLWFCLPTLFIYCRHSWEMSVDYKFTEGLMRVCFSGFLFLPLQRTVSTSWPSGGQGEKWGDWSSRWPLQRKRHSRLCLMGEVTGKDLTVFPWKVCLMAVVLKTWPWCGTSSISICGRFQIRRSLGHTQTDWPGDSEDWAPYSVYKLSTWFCHSGQLEKIYFTDIPLPPALLNGISGKVALNPIVLTGPLGDPSNQENLRSGFHCP